MLSSVPSARGANVTTCGTASGTPGGMPASAGLIAVPVGSANRMTYANRAIGSTHHRRISSDTVQAAHTASTGTGYVRWAATSNMPAVYGFHHPGEPGPAKIRPRHETKRSHML